MNTTTVLILIFAGLAVHSFATVAEDRRIKESRQGWRLRAAKYGSWIYEEKFGESWIGFELPEVTDYREPPHHLQIMSEARWSEYPTWAKGRRDEILTRIKSILKEPNYFLIEA